MAEFINKHSIKIQLGVACSVLFAVIFWAYIASAYVWKIDANFEHIEELEDYTTRVIILEGTVDNMQDDVTEIKQDVKTLLNK